MKIQKTLFIYVPMLLSLFVGQVEAKMFKCSFKVAGTAKSFDFDVVKNSQGTGGELEGQAYFLSTINQDISVLVQNSKTSSQTKTNFSVSRKEFSLSSSPGFDLSCTHDPIVPVVTKNKTKDAKLKLDEDTSLDKFEASLDFVTTEQMKVFYNVDGAEKSSRMRSIIFQKGRMYTLDDDARRDLNGNYCILQVKLELDQDTMINKGDRWQTEQYKPLDNNSTHMVYAYSFVDASQGKVTQRFRRYVPFNMACQVKKPLKFDQKMWREITGDRIKLYHNK